MRSLSRARAGVALLAVAMAGTLLACATAPRLPTKAEGAVLRGMVFDEERQPVVDAEVSATSGDGVVSTAITDLQGHFVLPELAFGSVSLRVKKEGFEPVSWSFGFRDPTQVAYVRMADVSELLDDAAKNIEDGDWKAAADNLARARAVDAANPVAAYLEALALDRQGRSAEAAESLEGLGAERPVLAIELLLADIYQYRLDEPARALDHLKKALAIAYDSDIQDRIAKLQGDGR